VKARWFYPDLFQPFFVESIMTSLQFHHETLAFLAKQIPNAALATRALPIDQASAVVAAHGSHAPLDLSHGHGCLNTNG
jgi:hypothetical protein